MSEDAASFHLTYRLLNLRNGYAWDFQLAKDLVLTMDDFTIPLEQVAIYKYGVRWSGSLEGDRAVLAAELTAWEPTS